MLTVRTAVVAAAIVAASLALSACAPSPGDSGPTSSASASQAFNQQDVGFTRMMIPHHEQAVKMADILLSKSGIDSRVVELAKTIKDEQQPEINLMQGWLDGWGDSAGGSGMDGSGGMNGMMSDADMTSFTSAEGSAATTLFLQGMIGHHQGAIDMADAEIADGKFPDAVKLAEGIMTAQQAEIDQMQKILDAPA